jgi:hypothetical protein
MKTKTGKVIPGRRHILDKGIRRRIELMCDLGAAV